MRATGITPVPVFSEVCCRKRYLPNFETGVIVETAWIYGLEGTSQPSLTIKISLYLAQTDFDASCGILNFENTEGELVTIRCWERSPAYRVLQWTIAVLVAQQASSLRELRASHDRTVIVAWYNRLDHRGPNHAGSAREPGRS